MLLMDVQQHTDVELLHERKNEASKGQKAKTDRDRLANTSSRKIHIYVLGVWNCLWIRKIITIKKWTFRRLGHKSNLDNSFKFSPSLS